MMSRKGGESSSMIEREKKQLDKIKIKQVFQEKIRKKIINKINFFSKFIFKISCDFQKKEIEQMIDYEIKMAEIRNQNERKQKQEREKEREREKELAQKRKEVKKKLLNLNFKMNQKYLTYKGG